MTAFLLAALAAANIGLLYALIAWRIGTRTIRMSKTIAASREQLWEALFPLGSASNWSGEILRAESVGKHGAAVTLSWEGRDGQPITRAMVFDDLEEGHRFSARIIDDSSLHPEFWRDYYESVELSDTGGATRVAIARTDSYRGLAFYIFRYFVMRRQLSKLDTWALTGTYKAGGFFEHPATQLGVAALSALIFWPFFGLTASGLAMAVILTCVVALHELGHIAAFRVMGHRQTRLIFIPLLGGVAIGGRPYDSRFEVGFVALMGAGFSAFVVLLAIAASIAARDAGLAMVATFATVFAGCAALFNLANLIPVWKFDGGQVLRQIIASPALLAVASFLLLSAFILVGMRVGFPLPGLLVGAAAFALLGLMTSGSGVKPRHALRPISSAERAAIGAGLAATFAIHACGVIWAAEVIGGAGL